MIPPTRRVRRMGHGKGGAAEYCLWVSHDNTLRELRKVQTRALRRPRKYLALNFFMVHFDDDVITSLHAMKDTRFESVAFFSCQGRVEDALRILCNDLTALSKLSLDCVDFSPKTAASLLDTFYRHDRLRLLSVTGSKLSGSLAECLMHCLQSTSHLETLVWKHPDRVDRRCFAKLLKGLYCNTSLLRVDMSCDGLCDEGVNCLLRTIKHHPTLKKMVLSVGDIRNVIGTLRTSFSSGTSKLESLRIHIRETLDCSCLVEQSLPRSIAYTLVPDMIENESIDWLGKALCLNPSIKKLDLSLMGIDDDAVASLASWLARSKGLRCLKLRGNRFGERGASALFTALKTNVTLDELELPSGCPRFFDLQYMVELNRAGRRLMLDDNSSSNAVPPELWPIVFERAQRISYAMDSPRLQHTNDCRRANALFYLLHGPLLQQPRLTVLPARS